MKKRYFEIVAIYLLLFFIGISCNRNTSQQQLSNQEKQEHMATNTKKKASLQIQPIVKKVIFYKNTDEFFMGKAFNAFDDVIDIENPFAQIDKMTSIQKAFYFWYILFGSIDDIHLERHTRQYEREAFDEMMIGLEFINADEALSYVKKWNADYELLLQNKIQTSDIVHKTSDGGYNFWFPDEINDGIIEKLEYYIKTHPKEFCVDEGGFEMEKIKAEHIQTFYENGQLQESIAIKDGFINGLYIQYHSDGTKESEFTYKNGKQEGKQSYYDEKGSLEKEEHLYSNSKKKEIKYFYPNGQISTIKRFDAKGERIDDYDEWHPNGTKKKIVKVVNHKNAKTYYIETFWEDGSIREKIEENGKNTRYIAYWNEKGEKLLENGTGYRMYTLEILGDTTVYHENYRNHKLHGLRTGYTNGFLEDKTEYNQGKKIKRYDYHENGNLSETSIYNDEGNIKSSKTYNEKGILTNSFLREGSNRYTYIDYYEDGKVEKEVIKQGSELIKETKKDEDGYTWYIQEGDPMEGKGKTTMYYTHFIGGEENKKYRTQIRYITVRSTVDGYFIDNSEYYWQNGKKSREYKSLYADSDEEETQLLNSWGQDGRQMVKNGKGIHIIEYSDEEDGEKVMIREEIPYYNYKENGKARYFKNGKLEKEITFINGEKGSTTFISMQ